MVPISGFVGLQVTPVKPNSRLTGVFEHRQEAGTDWSRCCWCCREVMDKSFHECYSHFESTCRTNSHLNGQPMQVRFRFLQWWWFKYANIHICVPPYGCNFSVAACTGLGKMGTPSRSSYESYGGPAVLGLNWGAKRGDGASHEHVFSPFASLYPLWSAELCVCTGLWSKFTATLYAVHCVW